MANVTAHDAYDSCFRMQASNAVLVNTSFTRAGAGVHVVYDASFLEGTKGIRNVSVLGNTFNAIGSPPAANMSEVLDADPDVQELFVENNIVTP